EVKMYAESIQRDLIVQLDTRPLELKLTSSACSASSELRTGFGLIQFEFSLASNSLTRGAHHLTLENRHLRQISVYLFNAAKPASPLIQITSQKRNENQSSGEINFIYQAQETSAQTTGICISAAVILIALLFGLWRATEGSRRSPE
ncbi:MAG: hypothetical protein JWM16_5299, partial [Verrucomicrobiales bacterium]|nr:hypothetical protein [Verrucomicrobiales bacterium]